MIGLAGALEVLGGKVVEEASEKQDMVRFCRRDNGDDKRQEK